MAQVLLHGILEATIFEIDKLSSGSCCMFFCKMLDKFEDLARLNELNSKLYVTIDLENSRVGRTRQVENNASKNNPRWCEPFRIYCAHVASKLVFTVKLENPIHTIEIATASFPAAKLLDGRDDHDHDQIIDKWLSLKPSSRSGGSKLHVRLRFVHVSRDGNWSRGLHGNFPGVPHTFFPQRSGCRVTLYQDAHVPDGLIPKIPLSGGELFSPNKCWEDIFDAISKAEHLIYIAGWSVFTRITLVRENSNNNNNNNNNSDALTLTLGELLKKKAEEGVKVLMLVWDDRTSVKALKDDGVMATHDEDTASYFKGSEVKCVLCPRNPDEGQSAVRDFVVATMFTHHQKTVVVDGAGESDSGERKRKITSFVGGLDLCDGRYDTPSHPIFSSLAGAHCDDFHQPNFRGGASLRRGGPREPWHDVHCKLEGPVAWDVRRNFEQRWKKQSGGLDDQLLSNDDEETIFIPSNSPIEFSGSRADESWNAQLFRSIDGGSAAGLAAPPAEACEAGLVSGKDHVVERSVQDAYINAIRRAKNFVYVENQYFLGSSFGWKINESNASNLVPKELSLKIASKIESGERFVVYVVVPMWPEGVPESGSVRAILNWQKMTMEMMYKDIVEALKAKGISEANPRDYLTFFCLGNRETRKSGEYEPVEKPEHGSDYGRAQRSRRFMIYVHAKMMIVDDEYIIIGSANINQRSMDGARDTEIAIGGYQPHHLSDVGPARGQIHGHRLSLWYEHMGMLDDAFLRPESLECVRKVNAIADKNWCLYAGEDLEQDLPGHLLSYPIMVTENGDVATRPGEEFFPDTKAKILGSKSELPSILTT